jgi:FAD/FMN-containing dehydrogenase
MITALINLVGTERVSDRQDILDQYSGPISPQLVVWPNFTDEVLEIVKWANANSVALIPVSSGKPRRRGASLPKRNDSIVVDLSRMKRIIRIDRKNKVVMLEPGVTFSELTPALKKHGLRPLMPFLPKASKSVLASCLDREPITIPRFHWDSSDPLLCTETVFGSGEILRTGSAAGPGSLEEQWASGQAQKNPQGPSQFDPFRIIQGSQGAIGITTWISMKCEFLPEKHNVLLAGAEDLEDLEAFNYQLLRRRLADEHFILNRTCLNAALGWNEKLPPWILVIGLSGHGILAKEEIEYRTGDTMDIAKEKDIDLSDSLEHLKAEDVKSLLNRPSTEPYWKFFSKGSCSEVLFSTTLDQVPRLYSLFLRTANNIGFPSDQIGVYIQPVVQGVNTHCSFDLYFNPDNAKDIKNARQLLKEGQQQLLDQGAFFSRPYGEITDSVFEKASPEMVEALRSVKKIFDPNNVLNPGTLCFEEVPK